MILSGLHVGGSVSDRARGHTEEACCGEVQLGFCHGTDQVHFALKYVLTFCIKNQCLGVADHILPLPQVRNESRGTLLGVRWEIPPFQM